MLPAAPSLAPLSAAASSARRLSQRATEELVRQIVARVAEAPAQLAAVLAAYAEPLIAFTADRRIVATNAAGAEVFGYAPAALRGELTDALLPVRLRQPDAPTMQASDALTTVELPGLRRDGSEPVLVWTFAAATTPAGPLFVMLVRDRAELDDALEALHASEQRFRLLVEGVRDHAVLLLDAAGRIVTWNTGAVTIKGWRAEEVIGQPYDVLYTPEDRAAGVPAANLATARREGVAHVTGWRVRKDGTRYLADATVWPLFTHDGSLEGFAKIAYDLTARRAAEEAERRLERERAAREEAEAGLDRLARLQRVARSLSSVSTVADVVDTVLDACLAELGARGGVVLQLTPDGQGLAHVGQRGHPEAWIAALGASPLAVATPATDAVRTRAPLFFGSAAEVEARYPALVERLRMGGFEASVALPLMTRGAVQGVLGVRYAQPRAFTEAERSLLLTLAEMCAQALERARLFEAEQAARAAAEDASRAKDEFLAMLGHELRNPLAPIATAVELMRLRGETHSLRERQVIERQLGHITRLVDDLLDIARITRGKLDLVAGALDLADVVARAVEIVSPLLEQRRHRLTLSVPRGLTLHADPERLAQVVSNLISNAAKYTPPQGHIEVTGVRDEGDVLLHVRDDGQGISPELLPRVFDLFVQGRRSVDRAEGGLGIGLALVKNLVTLHGGTVSATSTPGQGSTFTVRLPRVAAATDGAGAGTGEYPVVARPARPGRRVIIVDDNRDFAEMLASSLATLGYEVRTAGDGVTALARLREFPADAAVLDLGLPVLDGFDLARQIREEFPTRTPRLIAVTGYGQQHDRDRSTDVGFVDHLVKPIDMAAMVAALERTTG